MDFFATPSVCTITLAQIINVVVVGGFFFYSNPLLHRILDLVNPVFFSGGGGGSRKASAGERGESQRNVMFRLNFRPSVLALS